MPVSHCPSACQFHIVRVSLSLSGTTQNAGCTAAGSEADCQRHLWLHWCHFLWPYALYWGKRFSPPCVWVGRDVGLEDGDGCVLGMRCLCTHSLFTRTLTKNCKSTLIQILWHGEVSLKLNLKWCVCCLRNFSPTHSLCLCMFFAHLECAQCNHITVNQGVSRVRGKAAPEINSQMWTFLNSQEVTNFFFLW